jgi:hypothetical protein
MLEYIFNGTKFCRVLLYTPLILMGSILGSIIYDYVTYKEDEDKDEGEDEDEDEDKVKVKKND